MLHAKFYRTDVTGKRKCMKSDTEMKELLNKEVKLVTINYFAQGLIHTVSKHSNLQASGRQMSKPFYGASS